MRKMISLMMMSILLVMVALGAVSCGEKGEAAVYSTAAPAGVAHTVLIEVEDYGDIEVDLYESVAPITVKNFVDLVKKGFYDGLIFHRVISGFMIQGGDPLGNGTGDSGTDILGEFALNGFSNSLKHERGVISMARGGSGIESLFTQYGCNVDNFTENKTVMSILEANNISAEEAYSSVTAACNSGSCQFFIVHETSSNLDGSYAAFGRVITGIDVVDKIAAVSVDDNDKPLKDVIIKSITYLGQK